MARLLFIFLTLLISAPAYGLVVEFRQSAEVDDAIITLGDIANFDEDSELSKALATQHVAQAPSPGQKITLNTRSIITYLNSNIDQNTPVNWRGSTNITITRSSVQVSSTEILSIINTYLHEKKSVLPKATIRFIPAAQPLPFTLPAGEMSWEVIPSDPDIIDSSRFSIVFSVDGRVRKNMSVRGTLEIIAQVVVATGELRKGTVLSAQHIRMSALDIRSLRTPCLDPQQVIGKKLSSSVKAGDVISLHQVDFPPLVKKGELVRMIFRRDSLFITATGIARNDGVFDETIRVQNTGSHKIVYCRVAGPGVVEVAL